MAEAQTPQTQNATPIPLAQESVYIPEWKSLWLRFKDNNSARIGALIVIFYIVIAIAVPLLDDYNARRDQNLPARFTSPSLESPFGTDNLGRDIMRRVGHGAGVSLTVGLLSVSVSVLVGTMLGEIAGFTGGWGDSIIMRIMDVFLSFPSLLLAIALVAIFGPGLINAMMAIAIVSIPRYARLARSMAIGIRNEDFVMAAESIGARGGHVLWQHVLPNSLAPIIVAATLGLGTAVVETAALGFLGLGQQAPWPELGKMLAESQQYLITGAWWGMVFPGVAITIVVLGFNLLGDGLRDTLDPKLRGTE